MVESDKAGAEGFRFVLIQSCQESLHDREVIWFENRSGVSLAAGIELLQYG